MLNQLIHGVCGANSQAKSHRLLAGFAVLLVAAIFTFTGCPTDGGDDDNNQPGPGPSGGAPTLTDEQSTLAGYSGGAQTISGTLYKDYSLSGDHGNSQDLGTISDAGKVTINWPSSIPDTALWDGGDPGNKTAYLKLTAGSGTLVLKKGSDVLIVEYYKNSFTQQGVTAKSGWNFWSDEKNTFITDFTGYKWVLQ